MAGHSPDLSKMGANFDRMIEFVGHAHEGGSEGGVAARSIRSFPRIAVKDGVASLAYAGNPVLSCLGPRFRGDERIDAYSTTIFTRPPGLTLSFGGEAVEHAEALGLPVGDRHAARQPLHGVVRPDRHHLDAVRLGEPDFRRASCGGTS